MLARHLEHLFATGPMVPPWESGPAARTHTRIFLEAPPGLLGATKGPGTTKGPCRCMCVWTLNGPFWAFSSRLNSARRHDDAPHQNTPDASRKKFNNFRRPHCGWWWWYRGLGWRLLSRPSRVLPTPSKDGCEEVRRGAEGCDAKTRFS